MNIKSIVQLRRSPKRPWLQLANYRLRHEQVGFATAAMHEDVVLRVFGIFIGTVFFGFQWFSDETDEDRADRDEVRDTYR